MNTNVFGIWGVTYNAHTDTCPKQDMSLSLHAFELGGRGFSIFNFNFNHLSPVQNISGNYLSRASDGWICDSWKVGGWINKESTGWKIKRSKQNKNFQYCETFVLNGNQRNKILKWFWFSHTLPDSQKKKRKILWIPIVHAKRCGFDLSLHLPLSLFFSFVLITLIKCVKGL